jgi:hypothetical protein
VYTVSNIGCFPELVECLVSVDEIVSTCVDSASGPEVGLKAAIP